MKIQITDYQNNVIEVQEGDSISTGNLVISLIDNKFKCWNSGNPDNYGLYSYIPQPFYFNSIKALGVSNGYSPSLYPFDSSYVSYSDGANNDWVLVDSKAYKHKHKRYPISSGFHTLDGGDTFICRFIPYGNFSNPIPTDETHVLNTLNLDLNLIVNPYVNSALKLYDFTIDSLNPAAPIKNFGWRMVPTNFVSKHTSIDINFVKGWYGFGSTHSAGEGFTNEHYDHVLWWFLNGMLGGSIAAYDIGIEILDRKIAYGFIDCNSNILWKHWWREEKGQRRGDFKPSSSAKEWDLGLIVGTVLTKREDYKEVCRKRLNSLLTRTNASIWNGAGGGRNVGNYLYSMLAFYRFANLLGIDRNKEIEVKVSAFLTHVFSIVKQNNHFPNIYLNDIYPVWEEATAYSAVYKWNKILGKDQTKITSMIDWLIKAGSGWVDSKHYGVAKDIIPSTGQKLFTTPNVAAWWVPIWKIAEELWPGVYTSVAKNCTDTCYNNLGLTWAEIALNKKPLPSNKLTVELPGWGSSAEKQWPILLTPIVDLE